MIMVGNSRGNGQNLASHLLSAENERVDVHSVDGFMSEDLHDAFKEAEAVSRGTRCKKYLFSLSLNPPKNEIVETQVFEDTISRVEKQLNLTGQPKAVVFWVSFLARGYELLKAIFEQVWVDRGVSFGGLFFQVGVPHSKLKVWNIVI